jgi:AcrR family transcriptional regulator
MSRPPAPASPSDDPVTGALLDAALAEVRSGAEPTVAAVAARAGVSRGTVYRRYADREALLEALVSTGRLQAHPQAGPQARERILDAVGELLGRRGLSATTIEDVARKAEVGPVTVYRHFGDRSGLFRAFVAERTPRRLATATAPGGDPVADLTQLTRETLLFAREYRGLFFLLWSTEPEAVALLSSSRKGTGSVRAMVARAVNAVAPDPTGRSLTAYTGLLLAFAWNGPVDVDAEARFVVTSFCHGVPHASGRRGRDA